jgi:hypothetical protein
VRRSLGSMEGTVEYRWVRPHASLECRHGRKLELLVLDWRCPIRAEETVPPRHVGPAKAAGPEESASGVATPTSRPISREGLEGPVGGASAS